MFRKKKWKMNEDDINYYIPSILNPRAVRKQNGNLTLTQNSITSRSSLSLSLKRRNSSINVKKSLQQVSPLHKDNFQSRKGLQTLSTFNNVSKDRNIVNKTAELPVFDILNTVSSLGKENIPNAKNLPVIVPKDNTIGAKNVRGIIPNDVTAEETSVCFSAIEDLNTVRNESDSSLVSYGEIEIPTNNNVSHSNRSSRITVSSATELIDDTDVLNNTGSTIVYENTEEPRFFISFGVNHCDRINISTKNSNIKKINISHKDNVTNYDCEVEESSHISIESDADENMNEIVKTPPKTSNLAVNIEIKKKRMSEDAIGSTENSKVLILNADDIEKLSHVIVQPPNYKLVKRQILDRNKFIKSGKRKSIDSCVKNGKSVASNLKQKRIDAYLTKKSNVVKISEKTFKEPSAADKAEDVMFKDVQDMSKNLGVFDAVKCDHIGRTAFRSFRKDDLSPKSTRVRTKPGTESPRQQTIRVSSSDARRVHSHSRNDGSISPPPRKNVDSVQFSLPSKSKTVKPSASPRNIPHYKIVAGTHFAVDAFSYGEIPNVKHYFLTHFHSDHYSGLKKTFNKFLFCSKITADLCVARLGVNSKCIHVINIDETITVDGVEVTAVDANHCPGALMLIFTLPNGKTLLHTGDFRASPLMESYPIFWNKDINTVYLDTTYCNPRYDFPTQDQSLEMALYLLRQKKMALEKIGKKFASVLIVCGTYTIGKEKFFLGMARRVGCSVWACPEKDRVLQAVEGRSFSHAPPHSCQLHVVPMRDLTHEKLRSYLDSLQGAFTEVVAFKPSGWENGKNSTVENDRVTIHGIPYSEHSSFSELIRFVKFLKPKQVVPTVDISGGVKSVQKYFPCPLVCKEDLQSQSRVTDYFSIQNRQQVPAVT